MKVICLSAVFFLLFLGGIAGVQSTECSKTKPCPELCCSRWGWCGLGPDYCGPDADLKNFTIGGSIGTGARCSKTNPCKNCCSLWGWCGTSEVHCWENGDLNNVTIGGTSEKAENSGRNGKLGYGVLDMVV
ncbi:root-specific lectin-like [Mercurialis annua]|uniref:root-specific lectin-like n=1 Tax=Mercurialis annua TaxID=3986 RepID=UPI0021603A6D|nr:root-specific lectin-like [Mercurialis annua]